MNRRFPQARVSFRRNRGIERMFDRITPRYDLINHLLSAGMDILWRNFCVRRLPHRVENVLDIATGTGDLALAISRRYPCARVYGLDFAARMLKHAGLKARAGGYDREVGLVRGDALHLPFPDDFFNAATIAFGLRNISDRTAALVEMKRVVKAGGKVLVLEMTFPPNLKLRRFFQWYLHRVIPLVGGMLSGDRSAYEYLPDSIHRFLTPGKLAGLLRDAGMKQVKAFPLSLGIAFLHEGVV